MSLGQFVLLYLALYLGMPTGLAPLVIQVQVLFTVLLAAATLGEHPRVAQLAGVVIGLAGLSVVALGRAAVAPVLPLLLVVAAAASWAVGNVLTRAAKAASGLSMVVWSGLVVPVPMAVLSYLVEGPAAIGHALTHLTPVVIGSALFTAWLSSLLGYGIWNTLLSRHPARGGGTKNTAGRQTSTNRNATNNNGGTTCSPAWMTTKFTPQIRATRTASAVSRKGIPVADGRSVSGAGAVAEVVDGLTRSVCGAQTM